MNKDLTFVDHIAIESTDIAQSAKWYQDHFNCEVKHQDETWALLKFANISLALVTPGEHPPHFAVVDKKIIDGFVDNQLLTLIYRCAIAIRIIIP